MTNKTRLFESKSRRLIFAAFLIVLGALFAQILLSTTVGTAETPETAAPAAEATAPQPFTEVSYTFGRGYIGDGWQVYFNAPDSNAERSSYADGIETPLVNAIADARQSLDIAAFELNHDAIFEAILSARERGLAVRIVTDDEHGLEDERDAHLRELREAGVPVADDGRSALMHNKFMIIDGRAVWTGSLNYTINGAYRNNNNIFAIANPVVAAGYQAEFEEMFERGEFGGRSRDDGVIVARNGDPAGDAGAREISVIFAPETDEISPIAEAINAAQSSIHLMVFVFSLDDLADAIVEKLADPDVVVRGIFENRNSKASWSQLPTLHCAGAEMRQDGNPFTLHHKVMIIDAETVITGSFNFSKNAAESNDENIVIIRDAVIASLYLDEWQRVWDSAENLQPGEIDCA